MLVNWKHPRILRLGTDAQGGVTLKPGVQDVDAERFAWAQKNVALAKHYLDTGDLEVVEDPKGETVEAPDLTKLPAKQAVKLVKDTADETLLQFWHEHETRKDVIKAIEAQMKALAEAAEPEAKG